MAEGRYCEATRLQFGLFELDLRAGELRKAGVHVRLSGQPLRILELLVLRAGQVVTGKRSGTRSGRRIPPSTSNIT